MADGREGNHNIAVMKAFWSLWTHVSSQKGSVA
jgi:hypothetical protein